MKGTTVPGLGARRPDDVIISAGHVAQAARELTPGDERDEPTWVHRARSDGSIVSELVTASALRFEGEG